MGGRATIALEELRCDIAAALDVIQDGQRSERDLGRGRQNAGLLSRLLVLVLVVVPG